MASSMVEEIFLLVDLWSFWFRDNSGGFTPDTKSQETILLIQSQETLLLSQETILLIRRVRRLYS